MFFEIEEIRRRRKRLGITQKKLAELVGVSQPLIARIESGDVDPKFSLVKKIFEVLGRLEGMGVTAERIMNTPVVYVDPDANLLEAIDIMREKGFSQLPVIKGNRNVGCITESSILRVILSKGVEAARKMKVKDAMNGPLPEVHPNETLENISKMLLNSPALLVVDNSSIVGIITKHDVMKTLEEKDESEA
uniref:CBS domain-containing protein n=1 Tax=Geoglobus ahangari TaxID=113653 RepID=A0A7C3YF70_9EURY